MTRGYGGCIIRRSRHWLGVFSKSYAEFSFYTDSMCKFVLKMGKGFRVSSCDYSNGLCRVFTSSLLHRLFVKCP
jgi:hypothetical protein